MAQNMSGTGTIPVTAAGRSPSVFSHEPRTRWERLRYDFKHGNKWGYFFIAPLMIDFLIFTVYMVVRVVLLSFQDMAYAQTNWVGFIHFEKTFRDPQFWNAMKNTIIYTIGAVPGGILTALILSELIFRRSVKLQTFFKSAYYIPTVVSSVVLAIIWMFIFNPFYGILNAVIGVIGIGKVNWMGDIHTAMLSLILMNIIGGVGGPVVFLTAAMGGIPTDLYDAAKIDGCSEWIRFWRITIPLLRPTLLYLFVTGFIGHFQAFEQIYLMTQGGPGYPGATETVGYLIYTSAFQSMNVGLASAQSIILFFVILIFSVLQFRIFAADLEY
jgi:multiple sugar transport system permease protein